MIFIDVKTESWNVKVVPWKKKAYERHRNESGQKKARQNFIKVCHYTSHNSCLCTKHQSFALKFKALKSTDAKISVNLDTVTNQPQDLITYIAWKKVDILVRKGKEDAMMKKMKIVGTEEQRGDIKTLFIKKCIEFKKKCWESPKSILWTYAFDNIVPGDICVHANGFRKDFKCKTQDKIQLAYWNATHVTIHPTMIYYKQEGFIFHQSVVYISNKLGHSGLAVYSIMKKTVPFIKRLSPGTTFIRYWTNSPTSQHRNKYIFHLIPNHKKILHVSDVWSCFDSGHGKYPCNEIGDRRNWINF